MNLQLVVAFGILTAVEALAQSAVPLTSGSGIGGRFPVLARDADVVAYVAMVGASRELFAVATDGTPAVQLTSGVDVRVGHGVLDPSPPLSISDDGNRIAFWNATGVHVLDRQAATDVLVASANLLPMPSIAGDGSRVVYQDVVQGQLEVFVVDSAGAALPVPITTASGPGRRLPHVQGDRVLFQKLVGDHMELFVHDLATSTTSGPLTSGSGGGNRHGRLLPDGSAFVFEAVVGDAQTPMRYAFATGAVTTIAAGTSGSRLAQGDQDGQASYELTGIGPEVWLANPATVQLTSPSRGGHKLPAIDRHGQVVVWQQEVSGAMEVFARRSCWPIVVSHYGSHGTLSIGALQSFARAYRCTQTLGVTTPFSPGSLGAFSFGLPQALPLSGAPGNFLWVSPVAGLFVAANGTGEVAVSFPLSAATFAATLHCQFAVLDAAANSLGVVTSEGFQVQIH